MVRSNSITSSLLLSSASLAFALSACGNPASTKEEKRTIDTVIMASKIYSNTNEAPDGAAAPFNSIAIDGGKIIDVGMSSELEQKYMSTQTINLGEAVVFPGFVDAHAHLLGIGMRELTLNLEDTSSIETLVEEIEKAVQNASKGDVIYGRGWIETAWPEGRFPFASDLDAVSPDNPVILTRADGHAIVANSAALSASGVNSDTPDPDGGRIERNDDGSPNGMLIDNAMALVSSLVAAPTDERKRTAYSEANKVYAKYGWTGLHNMSVDPDNLSLIEELSDDGTLNIRVYNSVDPEGLDSLVQTGARTSNNGRAITRAVKLYVDGALGSRGAALSTPYSDDHTTSGLLLISEENALAQFKTAFNAGIQVNTHAIGDRGNKLLLNWYQETFANADTKEDVRWRIEHSQILHVEDIPRFAALGVIPSMQPSHAIGDFHFAPDRLGSERLAGAYAWRSLIDAGSIIAGGSDAPVERGDARVEFYAATARKDLEGFFTPEWNPAEAVSRAEALKMFTLWPAIASFQEDHLGTIEIGKQADFSVFSKDLMTIPETEILDTQVVMTMVDGEVIYRSEN